MNNNPNKYILDLVGYEFNKCKVIEKAPIHKTKSGQYSTYWICECFCGNRFEANSQSIRKGKIKSCGCYYDFDLSKQKRHIGEKYNRLTIIDYIPKEERKNVQYNYLCKCDCGNIIPASINRLKNGHTKSCGCLKDEVKQNIGSLNRKYKISNKRLYSIYKVMTRRCLDSTDMRYKDYGGRGITICDEWMGEKGFDNFCEWSISNGYKENLTIDRINVDGNYEPNNCRWITNKEQQNNRRNCHYIEYDGKTYTVTQWSEILNIPVHKFRYHIGKGKTIQEILDFYKDS